MVFFITLIFILEQQEENAFIFFCLFYGICVAVLYITNIKWLLSAYSTCMQGKKISYVAMQYNYRFDLTNKQQPNYT